MKLENLLGRRVRYKGEEGRVLEGHSGEQGSVVVSMPAKRGAARRYVTVPESDWQELELLDRRVIEIHLPACSHGCRSHPDERSGTA